MTDKKDDNSGLRLVFCADEKKLNSKTKKSTEEKKLADKKYVDDNGVVFFNERQRAEQREQRKWKREIENIVFVASGKGGVGKTWFTINLAQTLAFLGDKVLVLDADFSFANVDVQLGLLPECDLTHVVNAAIDFKDAITNYNLGDFDVVAGSSMSGSYGGITQEKIDVVWQGLAWVSQNYDMVLVDVGNAHDSILAGLFKISSKGIMVTTDEPSSLSDVYTLIKFVRDNYPAIDIDIVVNKVDNYTSGNVTFKALDNVTKSFLGFAPNLLGVIRYDDIVIDSIRNQVSTLTYAPQAKSIGDIRMLAPDLMRSIVKKNLKDQ